MSLHMSVHPKFCVPTRVFIPTGIAKCDETFNEDNGQEHPIDYSKRSSGHFVVYVEDDRWKAHTNTRIDQVEI